MTVAIEEPQWNSGAAWELPGWAEPVVCDGRRPFEEEQLLTGAPI